MSFNVLFINRPGRRKSRARICLRITISGQRKEIATGITGEAANWQQHEQRFAGSDKAANAPLLALKNKAMRIYAEAVNSSTEAQPSLTDFLALWDTTAQNVGLMELYDEVIDRKELEASKGKIAARTLERYHRTRTVLQEFFASENRRDLPIKKADIPFCNRFQDYLQQRNYKPAYVRKFFVQAKQAAQLAIKKGIIAHSPMLHFKVRVPQGEPPVYLTRPEVQRIAATDFVPHSVQMQRAADVFLFQCYTGLAYADTQRFDAARHLVTDEEGNTWLHIPRAKTGNAQEVPLYAIPEARQILEKYGNRLPQITNQKMNYFLKWIAQICGINKPISTHTGRKTAATYWLNSGFSYESVSRMIGHHSPEVTRQYYARINRHKIKQELIKQKSAGTGTADASNPALQTLNLERHGKQN
ncbi:site-specific integrase [Rhodoflexus caldus]|uniref:site-specific integrase n=1 Tax=Rhodoflexus caldus TaxID=2891236 RepID=UPI00202A62A4|nr:site-specific integrase [Rhodoflexus caldus]